jgi:hypothetical protein
VNKILAGLQDALEHAKHDKGEMVVQSIEECADGRARVTSRCEVCGSRETTFYPAGDIEFFQVN